MPWEPIAAANSQVLAIHAALLNTGEILYFGGDEHNAAQNRSGNPADIDNTRLYGTTAGTITPIGSPTTDVFCSGHALLPDGRLLVAGGTETWPQDTPPHHAHDLAFGGLRETWTYLPRERAWQKMGLLQPEPGHEQDQTGGGRWYPTLITLADGDALAVFGHPGGSDTRHRNDTPERYLLDQVNWQRLASLPEAEAIPYATRQLNYPRLHVIAGGEHAGRVFFATPVGSNRIYDAGPQRFLPSPTISPPTESTNLDWFGTSVLLPLLPEDGYRTRVLLCGGVQPLRITLPQGAGEPAPSWQAAGTRTGAAAGRVRENLCAVLLPTGEVFLSGGVGTSGRDADAVREAEIYDPGIDWGSGTYRPGGGSWRTAEAAAVVRNYHSVALLMPDGRVWTAGSSKNAASGDPTTVGELRIEIYRPPYVDMVRPEIRFGPGSIGYGSTFTIQTPDAGSIQRVAIVRAGSVTHAFDPDQRYVALRIQSRFVGNDPNFRSLTVEEPPSTSVAIPGWYLLFVLDGNGVPSPGKLVRVRYSKVRDVRVVRWPLGPGPVIQPEVERVYAPADFGAVELDLGTQLLGQSRSFDVLLRNTGHGRLDLRDVTTERDFTAANIRWDSPQRSLEPGQTATVVLLFSPGRAGPHQGAITVHTNALNAPALRVKLDAQVDGPTAVVEPTTLEFGELEVGQVSWRAVTVRNLGNRDAPASDLTIQSELPPGQFHIGQLPLAVPPGETRELPLAFFPTAVGPADARLRFRVRQLSFVQDTEIVLRGTGAGPVATLAPASLTFVDELIRRTSPPQQVTLTNVGTRPLQLTRVEALGEFEATATCPPTLGPGQSCPVEVRFRPALPGPRTGVLSLVSNTVGSAPTVALSGLGLAEPIVALDPASLTFGNQPAGTTGVARTVTLTNDGAADLQLTAISVAGANAGEFVLDPGTCQGALLAPEQRCTLTVRFSPTATGTRAAALTIASNATGSPHTVALDGTGTPPPAATLNPTGLDFGRQPAGTRSPAQTVTLANNGTTAINLADVSVTGQDADQFRITATTCAPPTPLAPGASCTIQVAFAPTGIGARSAALTVTDDAPGSPRSVRLDGTGTGAALVFDPPEVEFPLQLVGSFSQRQDVTLTNVGNAPVTIASLTVSGEFRSSSSCAGTVLVPGGFCVTRLVFSPTATGPRSGAVTAVDAQGTTVTAPLRGTGGVPVVTVAPATLAFGDHTVGGTSAAQTVTVTNTGSWPLTIANTQVQGANPSEFPLGPDDCEGAVLRTGEACIMRVSFAPTAVGGRAAELTFTSNASATPHSVPLSGTGI